MNALDFLKSQHRTTETLFDELSSEDDRRERRDTLHKLARVLRTHMEIEEKLFYPAAQKATGDPELIVLSLEEHAVARSCLETLEKTPPADKRFVARAKVLETLFDAHVQFEENELFPRMESDSREEDLEKLGDQLERRARSIEAREVPTAARGKVRRAALAQPKRRPARTPRRSAGGRTRSARAARSTGEGRASRPQAEAGGKAPRRGESSRGQ